MKHLWRTYPVENLLADISSTDMLAERHSVKELTAGFLHECSVCISARIITHVLTLHQDNLTTLDTFNLARGIKSSFVNLILP